MIPGCSALTQPGTSLLGWILMLLQLQQRR
ncbi:hypothetical protein J7M23_05870 [Candidatus Sumerlaeota bacterium]|nr:hypothetical protein [Candidatus Sumerlaeota bacterium]